MARRRMTRSQNRIFLALFWASLVSLIGVLVVGAPGGALTRISFYLMNAVGLFFGVMSGVLLWAATRMIRRLDMKSDPKYAEAYALLHDVELAEG